MMSIGRYYSQKAVSSTVLHLCAQQNRRYAHEMNMKYKRRKGGITLHNKTAPERELLFFKIIYIYKSATFIGTVTIFFREFSSINCLL
jgi:hypothetical protein